MKLLEAFYDGEDGELSYIEYCNDWQHDDTLIRMDTIQDLITELQETYHELGKMYENELSTLKSMAEESERSL